MFRVMCQGEVTPIEANCANDAAYVYVMLQQPELPSGTQLLVTSDNWGERPGEWLLRLVRNRTKFGVPVIQFRDLGAEKRNREFRVEWAARAAKRLAAVTGGEQ